MGRKRSVNSRRIAAELPVIMLTFQQGETGTGKELVARAIHQERGKEEALQRENDEFMQRRIRRSISVCLK